MIQQQHIFGVHTALSIVATHKCSVCRPQHIHQAYLILLPSRFSNKFTRPGQTETVNQKKHLLLCSPLLSSSLRQVLSSPNPTNKQHLQHMADHGNVVIVTNKADFDNHVTKAKAENKIVVIDFTATWCGPCRFIAPIFAQLSKKFTNVLFLKVDVDDQKDVAEEYKVEAMPTFLFLKDGVEIDKIVGADKNGLEIKVAQLAATAAV